MSTWRACADRRDLPVNQSSKSGSFAVSFFFLCRASSQQVAPSWATLEACGILPPAWTDRPLTRRGPQTRRTRSRVDAHSRPRPSAYTCNFLGDRYIYNGTRCPTAPRRARPSREEGEWNPFVTAQTPWTRGWLARMGGDVPQHEGGRCLRDLGQREVRPGFVLVSSGVGCPAILAETGHPRLPSTARYSSPSDYAEDFGTTLDQAGNALLVDTLERLVPSGSSVGSRAGAEDAVGRWPPAPRLSIFMANETGSFWKSRRT